MGGYYRTACTYPHNNLILKSSRNATQFQDVLASAAANTNKLQTKSIFTTAFVEHDREV